MRFIINSKIDFYFYENEKDNMSTTLLEIVKTKMRDAEKNSASHTSITVNCSTEECMKFVDQIKAKNPGHYAFTFERKTAYNLDGTENPQAITIGIQWNLIGPSHFAPYQCDSRDSVSW